MKKELALFGNDPAFEPAVNSKHLIPDWPQFESLIDGIFDRRYYTNHGPLALEFEKRFREFFGVNNALYMTNSGIGLMITSRALDVKGKVIIPAFAHVSVAQAVMWAGAEPVYCDVDNETMHLDLKKLEALIDANTCAILGVNQFGGSCDCEAIDKIAAKHSIKSYYLSDDGIGQTYKGKKVGVYGSLEVFSLHESKIINAVNGCVVASNDDSLSEKIRQIRSSYGLGKPTPVAFTGNGRMSEMVAGMALVGLDKFEERVSINEEIFKAYVHLIGQIKGLSVYHPDTNLSNLNYHRIIVRVNEAEFGLSAVELTRVLQAEHFNANLLQHYAQNVTPPYNSISECPNAVQLGRTLLEFPVSALILNQDVVERLKNVLLTSSQEVGRIRSQLIS